MKVLLDTDVLLDVALHRTEFYDESAQVLEWAEASPGQAAVAWHSLSNLAYLVRPDARSFLRELLKFVEVARADTGTARQALDLPLSDLEDALQAASALAFGASLIVTRNLAHYRSAPVPAVSPGEFLKRARGTR